MTSPVKSAGVVGGRLYSSFKLSDALNLGASVAYLTEEEDEFVESDGYQLAAGLTYAILDNTSIQLQLQYEDMDYKKLVSQLTTIMMRSAPVPASSSSSKIL